MGNNNTKPNTNEDTCFSENKIPEENIQKENCCCCLITDDQRDVIEEHRSNCCLSNFYLCLFCVEDCMCSCLERFTGVY